MFTYYFEIERAANIFSFVFTESVTHLFAMSHKAVLVVGGASSRT